MKTKINVVWIHSHFLFWMGGTKFIHQVIAQLLKIKQINKIYIIVENTSKFSRDQYSNMNVEFISLDSLTSTSPHYWTLLPYFLYINYKKIEKILIKNKLNKDNSVIISSMFPMNVLGNMLPLKHIQSCYEPFAFFYDKNFVAQFSSFKRIFIDFLSILYAPLDKWATRNANQLLTLNSTTQNMITDIYGVNSIKTQAGVNSKLFKPYISAKIKRRYKNNKIVIHSTDYSPVKGTDLVIKAFAKIANNVPGSLLLITTTIDDKTKKDKLVKFANSLGLYKRVQFMGFLPIKELPQYYSLANVMVQGAFSEKSGTTSMSLPVKEAMCCETAAIRPNMGGEDVINGKTGYLVDPRNTNLLAKKMKILLLDKKLSNKMGKDARIFIKKKYTWKNTAEVFYKQVTT